MNFDGDSGISQILKLLSIAGELPVGFRLRNIADKNPFLPVLHIGRDEIIHFPYYQLLLLVILGGVNPVQLVDILLNCTYPRDIAALIERLNGFRETSYKKIKPELMHHIRVK